MTVKEMQPVDLGAFVTNSFAQTNARPLRVALVHDWLTGMRGGEKVLESLCDRFPDAPLWTLLHVKGSVSETISNRPIHTSAMQYLPFAKSKYRHYLPFIPSWPSVIGLAITIW